MKQSITCKVLKLLKEIPKGKVTTYKELAIACNFKCYRAIGQILKRNPRPDLYPCYRVIKSDGGIGGYSGSDPKSIKRKIGQKIFKFYGQKDKHEGGNSRNNFERYKTECKEES